jgi:hypothetical protein
LKRWWFALPALLVAAACGEETPTEVGAGLLPTDAVRTFEIVLEPAEYMVFDTAFGEYSDVRDMDYSIIANMFEGALNSNALARFSVPLAINVTDTLDVSRIDTMATFIGGTVRVVVDTIRSVDAPVRLALYRTAEQWDPSATWQHRSDVDGVRLAWATPGGTRGALVDTATWTVGADTVRFRVDAATIAEWRDTTVAGRGALIVAETPGSRLRTSVPLLQVHATSTHRPDTVFTIGTITQARTFIFEPQLATVADHPRVGGTPAWRTILQLREGLDTLSFPCPGVPNCRFRLSDVTLNHAGLRLQPVMPPPGFSPESNVTIGAYLLLANPQLPLQRSPLGDLAGVASVPRSSFLAPAAPVVELAITELIRLAIMSPERRGTTPLPRHIALVPSPEPRLFGVATFAAMPRLRLVVSTVQELQLP